MTLSKKTYLEAEEEELKMMRNDGIITEADYKQQLAELRKNYSRKPITEKTKIEDI